MTANPNEQQTLSVCMIVRNEAKNLPECLKNIRKVASEMVVVDTGSDDDTIEVAKGLGAKVFEQPWTDDFSEARNASLSQASGDWLLWLDGDDRMEEEDCRKVAELVKRPKDRCFYFVLVGSESGSAQCHQLRMVPNLPGVAFRGRIHEQLAPSLSKLGIEGGNTDVRVVHTGYADLDRIDEKGERNLRILKKQVEEQPNDLLSRFYYGYAYALTDPTLAMSELESLVDKMEEVGLFTDLYRHTRLTLGEICEHNERLDDAYDGYQILLERCPDYTLGHFLVARCAIARGQYGEAKEHLEIAIRKGIEPYRFPLQLDDLRAKMHLAMATCMAAEEEDLAGALYEAKKALSICPEMVAALVQAARLSAELGHEDDSQAYLERALDRDPENADALAMSAETALATNDLIGARELAERAADAEAAHSLLLVKIGDGYMNEGNVDTALDCFRSALSYDEQQVGALVGCGNVAFQTGDDAEARTYYERAAQIETDSPPILNNLGNVEFRAGRFAAAAQNYSQAIALGMDEAEIRMNFAAALRQLGQGEQALSEYETAFAQNDSLIQIMAEMGDIRLEQGQHQQALEMYEGYLRRDPTNGDGFCRLGNCYEQMGADDAARACYEQALKLQPEHPFATERLAAGTT